MTTLKSKLTRASRKEQTQSIILQAATETFLKVGYDALSINQLVKETGGSKETVYKYFKNKDGLILAIIDNEILKTTIALDDLDFKDMDLRQGLEYIGIKILETIMTERFFALSRLVMNAAVSKPELGQDYYNSISERSYKILAGFLSKHIDNNELKPIQAQRLAQYYWAMMLHDASLKVRFQVIKGMTAGEIRQYVAQIVDDFLFAFGRSQDGIAQS